MSIAVNNGWISWFPRNCKEIKVLVLRSISECFSCLQQYSDHSGHSQLWTICQRHISMAESPGSLLSHSSEAAEVTMWHIISLITVFSGNKFKKDGRNKSTVRGLRQGPEKFELRRKTENYLAAIPGPTSGRGRALPAAGGFRGS